jgi:hypothetical protein
MATLSGSYLNSLTEDGQIEVLYIGYFNRAGDGGGETYWANSGLSTGAIAESFAVQPEVIPLGDLGSATFINNVYHNLFARNADDAGIAYWQAQIQSGVITTGQLVAAIADGAQNSDQLVLDRKGDAAGYFTGVTYSHNQGSTPPLSADFLTAAHNAVSGVFDGTTLADRRRDATRSFHLTRLGLASRPQWPTGAIGVLHEQDQLALVRKSLIRTLPKDRGYSAALRSAQSDQKPG